MTLRDYRRVLVEQWRPWVAGLLLGLVVAGGLVLATPTRYTSQTSLYVTTPSSSADLGAAYDGARLAAEKAGDYAPLVTQDRLASTVADRLGPPLDGETVASAVTASAEPDTPLVTIAATASTPEGAQILAAATGDALVAITTSLEQPAPGAAPDVTLRIVEPATFPATPESVGAPTRLALGAGIGLAAGLLFVLIRHAADGSVRSRRDARAATGADVLTVTPYDRTAAKDPVIGAAEVSGPRVEAFRRLRMALEHDPHRPLDGILVVTSALAGEGTTTVVADLATMLARGGRSVLVVDANVRRPRLHTMLGLDGSVGLTSVLTSVLPLVDAVGSAPAHGFDVLPAGELPADPAEVLGGAPMAEVLAVAGRHYDTVLVDTAPAVPVPDAALVSRGEHGVLLVLRAGRTTADDAERAAGALATVGARVVGSVLTMVTGRDARPAPYRATRPVATPSPAPAAAPAPPAAPVPPAPPPAPSPGSAPPAVPAIVPLARPAPAYREEPDEAEAPTVTVDLRKRGDDPVTEPSRYRPTPWKRARQRRERVAEEGGARTH